MSLKRPDDLPDAMRLAQTHVLEHALGAGAPCRLNLDLRDVRDPRQKVLLDLHVLDAFDRDAAVFSVEHAALNDHLLLRQSVAEAVVLKQNRRERHNAVRQRHEQVDDVLRVRIGKDGEEEKRERGEARDQLLEKRERV